MQDSQESQYQFACQVHHYLQEFIRSADQKASFLLAAASVLLALVGPLKTHGVGVCLQSSVAVLAGLSVVLCLAVVWPRQRRHRHGLIFWKGILAQSEDEYLTAVADLDGAAATKQILMHCYALARILEKKYDLLPWAVPPFVLAGMLAVIALMFQA